MRNVRNPGYYRRRGVPGRARPDSGRSVRRDAVRAVRLAVCISIFAIAAAVKLLFPAAMDKVGSDVFRVISGDVNYRAAAEAIGRGIGGETGMKEALADAWIYAFVQDDGAAPAKAAANGGAEEV